MTTRHLLALAALFCCLWRVAPQGIKLCDAAAVCKCPAPRVRAEGISFTKVVNGTMCICFCGSEMGGKCKTDGQCVPGSYCGFGYSSRDASHSSVGKCTSLCNTKRCPSYYGCQLSSSGEPICSCQSYSCDDSEKAEVCGTAAEDRTIRRFANYCQLVNENCRRTRAGRQPMKAFTCTSG